MTSKFTPKANPACETQLYRIPVVRSTVANVPNSFDRIIRADRPLTTTFALVGVGFALSLLAGLLVGFLADDFRSAFGWTVALGMLTTAVVIIALLAIATARR